MNISYQWLRALLPQFALTPEETAETLALRGAPVEELIHLAPGIKGLVVGKVDSVAPHPDADRLSVCQVDAGGESLQVVCGAPTIQVGGFYPFAPSGSTLPGGLVIKAVKIRGVESNGMLCSEAELEMGPDASGIMLLEGEYTPGESLASALGLDDARMDVEITPNRGDLLSHIGIARELAPAGAEGITLPEIPGRDSETESLNQGETNESTLPLRPGTERVSAQGVTISIQDPELCSRYLGAVIRGVTVGPSPAWLQARLRAAGSRPINNVVDATNYVLLELGQPLHAFDLSKLGGSAIVVRTAKEGEALRTLDGEDRELKEGMLAICDAEDPVAIAGVMGGADSEVSEESTEILIECALFDPKSIRATRNALEMSTDASFRFERGVDPAGMELAIRRAVEIILATAGGAPDPGILDVCPVPWTGLQVSLRPSRVKTLLGITLSETEVSDLLLPLGFKVAGHTEEAVIFDVPGFRSYDTRREVDLLEEVARTYGYDRFPSDLRPFRPGTVPDDSLFQVEDEVRDLLVGEGFLEAQTMAFAPPEEGSAQVKNPVSMQENHLRTDLLPGLLRRIEYNFARGIRDVRLFEVGTVFGPAGENGIPREEARVCVLLSGSRQPAHWSGDVLESDLWYLKGLLARLVPAARIPEAGVRDGAPTDRGILPLEGFTLEGEGDRVLGLAGRVDPERVDAPAWAGPVWGLEIALPAEPGPKPVPIFRPPPAFPGVDRDLALLLPNNLQVRKVEELIRGYAGPLLVDLQVFDLYEGKGIPEGHRSVAFRFRYQSEERTLTDGDVDESVGAVTSRLREELGVEPRA